MIFFYILVLSLKDLIVAKRRKLNTYSAHDLGSMQVAATGSGDKLNASIWKYQTITKE